MKYPKQVTRSYSNWPRPAQINPPLVYDVLSIREIDKFVLAVVALRPPPGTLYTILAFPIEEGIGGRSVHQWNAAYMLSYHTEQDSAEGSMNFGRWESIAKKITMAPIPMDPRW